MGDASGLVTSVCTGIGLLLGGWALVVKARASESRPLRVLRRVWDRVEGEHLQQHFPPLLRRDVYAVLSPDAGEDDE